MWEKHKKKGMLLLWVAVILASIKSILTDTGFDNAYTVAMSFRHLKGDGMFEQMWEPHQTSIFFTDFFMWIYRFFVPSYAGVMLYLQVVGTVFFALIGIWLYRLLKDVAGSETAQLATMFFIMFRAKQTPFPDFANLQIGFSTLLFLCLVSFVRKQQKKGYLCLAAVFLCLEVLAYPSCLLAWLPAALILFWKTEERWKNIGLFTGVCALFGGTYVGYFVCKIGARRLLQNVSNIIHSDTHSGEPYVSLSYYFSGIIMAVLWLSLSAAFTWLLLRALKKLLHRSVDFFAAYGLVLFLSELLLLVMEKKTGQDGVRTFYIIPVLLMALSCCTYRDMKEEEKTAWLTGNLFALSSFLSTCLLTDLGLLDSVSYMVLGGVVSLAALRHRKGQIAFFLFTICLLVTTHRGLVVWGYPHRSNIRMVQEVDTIVRSGPSLGIVCDYFTYYTVTYDAEDFAQFVEPEDALFLVGNWLIDPMEFLLTDADISNYSTIDVPLYNEKLLDYLELYPEKKPTVVAVSCYHGQMQVMEDTWIMQWIKENYETVGDGRFWRFYREKESG